MKRIIGTTLLAALIFLPAIAQVAPRVDVNLQPYRPIAGVNGPLNIAGSDSMDPVVQQWLSGFRKLHPEVTVKSSAQGSESGYLSLVEGTGLIATMSREMSKPELANFEAKFGYQPTRVVVCVGALGVFVHSSNPVQSLTMEQLDAIFSSTRKQGYKEPITTWGQLGLNGDWANRKINPYGRDEHSGTRSFFRDKVMLKGDFRPSVNAMGDPSSLTEAIALDAAGIGYGSFNDANSLLKVVPIVQASGKAVLPTVDEILKGSYGLVRFNFIYVNKAAGKPLPAAVSSFLNYVLSRDGQSSVANVGLIPIPADLAKAGALKVQ
jgi:phosphate transport system substrate-binding protein